MSLMFKRRAFPVTKARVNRRAVIGKSPDILRQWSDADTELVLWHRHFDPSVQAKLNSLDAEEFPQMRVTVVPRTADVAIENELRDWASRHKDLFESLGPDIESLVARFSNVTGSHEIKLRLEAISDDACPLFHFDHVRARLVTTYIGPGTEWIPGVHASDALAKQDDYQGPIYQMPRFAVGLFPGSQSSYGGLLHRSPRVAATGQHRLLLCLTEAA